jgi:hypothetical protein
MKRNKFIFYIIVTVIILFLICAEILFMAGRVTINIKAAGSNRYVRNVSINIQPDLKGISCPGTDAGGPNVFTLYMPTKSKISIRANGYKDKRLNLILVPFKKYTIYLEPNS